MQRQCPFYVAAVDELIHLAIGIARNVAQYRVLGGFLVQPVNRHDREQLLDRPAVGHALEEREIAEVCVRKHGVESFEFFGEEIEFPRQLLNLAANRPEEILGDATLVERQITQAEQVQRGIERLLCVVIGLEQIARGDRSERLLQIDQRLLGIGAAARGTSSSPSRLRRAR